MKSKTKNSIKDDMKALCYLALFFGIILIIFYLFQLPKSAFNSAKARIAEKESVPVSAVTLWVEDGYYYARIKKDGHTYHVAVDEETKQAIKFWVDWCG